VLAAASRRDFPLLAATLDNPATSARCPMTSGST